MIYEDEESMRGGRCFGVEAGRSFIVPWQCTARLALMLMGAPRRQDRGAKIVTPGAAGRSRLRHEICAVSDRCRA